MDVIHQSPSITVNFPTNIFQKSRDSAKIILLDELLQAKSNSFEQRNSPSATLTIASNYSASSQNCYGISCQGNPGSVICTITQIILYTTLYPNFVCRADVRERCFTIP